MSADKSMRTLSAAATEELSCEFGSTKYFVLCSLGGVLSCGITHTAVTPLDLVKCRLQVDYSLFIIHFTPFREDCMRHKFEIFVYFLGPLFLIE